MTEKLSLILFRQHLVACLLKGFWLNRLCPSTHNIWSWSLYWFAIFTPTISWLLSLQLLSFLVSLSVIYFHGLKINSSVTLSHSPSLTQVKFSCWIHFDCLGVPYFVSHSRYISSLFVIYILYLFVKSMSITYINSLCLMLV